MGYENLQSQFYANFFLGTAYIYNLSSKKENMTRPQKLSELALFPFLTTPIFDVKRETLKVFTTDFAFVFLLDFQKSGWERLSKL